MTEHQYKSITNIDDFVRELSEISNAILIEFDSNNPPLDLEQFKENARIKTDRIIYYLNQLMIHDPNNILKNCKLHVRRNLDNFTQLSDAETLELNNDWPEEIAKILFKFEKIKIESLLRIDTFLNEHFDAVNSKNHISSPQQSKKESKTKLFTKHFVLAYLIECNAKGEKYPSGEKSKLEKIGNQILGSGKGNTFYKMFNEITDKDLNVESNLIEIGGENWRNIVLELSKDPNTVEAYLQSKRL